MLDVEDRVWRSRHISFRDSIRALSSRGDKNGHAKGVGEAAGGDNLGGEG